MEELTLRRCQQIIDDWIKTYGVRYYSELTNLGILMEEAANVFVWRELDATKNSVSMAARHYYAHQELHGKTSAEMQEMLWQKGVNWNDYPAFFKRGTYVQKQTVTRQFTADEIDALPAQHEARKHPGLTVERTEVRRLDLPPLARVVNRVDVIFYGAQPEVRQE